MANRTKAVLKWAAPSVCAGLLCHLCVHPFGWWPLAFVALIPLIVAVEQTNLRGALGAGWLFGLTCNLVGFWWIPDVLGHFGDVSTAYSIPGLLIISIYQGSTYAFWAAGCHWLARWRGVPWVLSGPLLLVVAEALVVSVFPWQLGFFLWRAWPITQVAELGGLGAVSALMLLVNLVLLESYRALHGRQVPRRLLVAAAVLLVVNIAGGLRLIQVKLAMDRAPHLTVGVVQTNTGIMSPKMRASSGDRLIRELRATSAHMAEKGAELIVWPETAFPFLFDRSLRRQYPLGHPWAFNQGDNRALLLVGALSHDFGTNRIFNSSVLVRADGEIAGIYDKSFLLPFGEYIPFADKFPAWAKRWQASASLTQVIFPGNGPRVLADGALRIGTLICYEDILPQVVHALARLRPNLIVNSLNHAWFGDSRAATHAYGLASLRAIETRRSLIRAATTGVSSVTDPLGREVALLPVRAIQPGEPQAAETLQARVPLLEVDALAPVTASGFAWICALGLLAGIWVGARPQKPASPKERRRV